MCRYVLIGIALISLISMPAAADVLVQESFDYEIGDLDGSEGGVGFSSDWFVESEGTFEIVEMDPPMQYSVPGGAVINGGSTALRFGNDFDDFTIENETMALSREFEESIDEEEVFFSYLYRYDEDGFIDNNDFVVWWFNASGGPQVGLKGNGGDGSVPDDIVGRVNFQFAPPHQAYVEESDISEEEGTIGTDFFIVGRMTKSDFSDNPDDYDEFAVWVNPTASEANTPHAVAEATFDNSLEITLDSIGLRVFSQEPGDAMFWDGLRIGQTWEDVTSALGEPSVGVPGDFNGDGAIGVEDINELSAAVRDEVVDAKYDLNSDGAINNDDRVFWVQELKQTWFGDANLDGEFGSNDFVFVFQKGEYEDSTDGNSDWGDGDWNGDGDFNSSDFVTAFQGGGFEVGPRPATAAVPEPSSGFLMLLSIIALTAGRRATS